LGKKSFASEVGYTPKNLLGDLSVHKSKSHSSRILQDDSRVKHPSYFKIHKTYLKFLTFFEEYRILKKI
jgi:hypothetical protein